MLIEKRDDWLEVNNYINAINMSIESLERIPISNRLIKRCHKFLLNSVRGSNKLPGEFRKSQNWIGGNNPSDAVFVPPHHIEIAALMQDLEKFIHNQEIQVPHLIKITIIHYQFETIHLFLDGNGRIGRLLITLYLVSVGMLKKPSLYLSAFIENNKSDYYNTLTLVREKNELGAWIKFFLQAVIETSEKSIGAFEEILKLKETTENKIASFGKRTLTARKMLNFLYKEPVCSVADIQKELDISKQATHTLVKDFQSQNIIVEITGYGRNQIFKFKDYLDIYQNSK